MTRTARSRSDKGKPILWVFFCFGLIGSFASELAFADSELIERWFVDSYVDSYLKEAPDFFEAHYTEQVRFITPAKSQLLSVKELSDAMTVVYVNPWLARGWDQTELIDADVTALSNSTYLLSAEWRMTNSDGVAVTHCARPVWHYLITLDDNASPRIYSEVQGECRD